MHFRFLSGLSITLQATISFPFELPSTMACQVIDPLSIISAEPQDGTHQCSFTIAIEYRDPHLVLGSFASRTDDDSVLKMPTSPMAGSTQPTTLIHSMQTACDPALAIPHFQDLAIADVVRTYGESAEAFCSFSQNNQSVAELFSAALNSVVITLFAKHAELGLCALSEINLQLNSHGHLSAWNPERHATLLQLRAETFCTYFYQHRYSPFEIIALVSAGCEGVPLEPPATPSHASSPHNTPPPADCDGSECASSNESPTLVARSDDSQSGLCAAESIVDGEPESVSNLPGLAAQSSPNDGKDRRDLRGSSIRKSGFCRFGRDLSPGTFSRISDRTLSILGLGDVVNHRDILLGICQGKYPLLAKPPSSAFTQPPGLVPQESFRDVRGAVILSNFPAVSPPNDFSLPDALSGLMRIYAHDPAKAPSSCFGTGAASDFEDAHSTRHRAVAASARRALSGWAPRVVVALNVRPSPSGATVVVVEFSRKQEANDFRRYLAAFQKFGFLSVFKVQAARQLVSDPCQFNPPNVDPAELESTIFPEEVTADSLLSSVPIEGGASSPRVAVSDIQGGVEFVIGVCDDVEFRGKKSADQHGAEVGLRLLELLSSSGRGFSLSTLHSEFIGVSFASHITLGIPHLGGPNRRVGQPANNESDFVSLESFLLRIQSEVLGSAQIKNPMGHVSVLEKLQGDATVAIGDMLADALARVAYMNAEEPNTHSLPAAKLLLNLEATLLSLAVYLTPLAVYTRTLLCDMGACHSRTLGRMNRGIVRHSVSKATSLIDGLCSNPDLISDSLAGIAPGSVELQCTSQEMELGVANVLLEMALLFATVCAQWDALFDKAAFHSGGSVSDQSQRYTIRPDTDKQCFDTKPLQDQSLRLVQLAAARLGRIQPSGSDTDVIRILLLTVRRRSAYFSFYNSNRAHWPLSLQWMSPPPSQSGPLSPGDDYQSITFVPFVRRHP